MAKKATNPNPTSSEKENTKMNKVGMTTKDLLNAKSSSVQLKGAPPRFEATGFAISEDVDRETGELREVGYIASAEGTVYGTISATAIQAISGIIDAVTDGDFELPVEVGVSIRKSNAGRDFITLNVF